MMSLQKIEEMRGRHAENPFNEIACMSFLHSQGMPFLAAAAVAHANSPAPRHGLVENW